MIANHESCFTGRLPNLQKKEERNMKRTANYALPDWEKSDFIKMDDFNDAFGKLDAALKAEADATAEKADGAAVAALQNSIGTVGKNCRLVYGSYVGDGRVGENQPVSLAFDFYPAVILVTRASGGRSTCFIHGCSQADSTNGGNMIVTWTNGSVTWCYNGSSGYDMNNGSGETYYYVALGYEN